mmetsp:Transcript_15246/g.21213  ORF Transcript_15246/g.21213 Transcript_15246/m.21213 type:complete len:142 (+) Transcript_15246:78-503(+)
MRGAGRFLLAVIVVSSMGTKTEWGVGPIANYIREIKATMDIAKYASLATFSRTSEDINSRIIFPKPTNVTKADKVSMKLCCIYSAGAVHCDLEPNTATLLPLFLVGKGILCNEQTFSQVQRIAAHLYKRQSCTCQSPLLGS